MRRTWLFVPGADPAAHEAAARSGADVIVLELEDFTPPALRAGARSLSAAAFARWRRAGALAAVRINPLEGEGLDDLAGIAPPDVLITADDVVNGKPDAEGYLAAARQIGVAAERTVVFEDAASGVLAARAAGFGAVVGVGARALETDADVVVEDLRGITWQGGALQIQGAGILRAGRG